MKKTHGDVVDAVEREAQGRCGHCFMRLYGARRSGSYVECSFCHRLSYYLDEVARYRGHSFYLAGLGVRLTFRGRNRTLLGQVLDELAGAWGVR